MEKQPSFVLKLSLEEMALRRVVVNLWNESDSLYTNQNFLIKVLGQPLLSNMKDKERWRDLLEGRVKVEVWNLVLPDSLKKKMMHLVRPIGYQILRWKISYKEFDAAIPEKLCWTFTGAVDNRRTAEKVVRLEKFDVVKRYELACSFCLDDYLPLLWEELPKEIKKDFCLRFDHSTAEVPLEVYWAYVLKGEKSLLDSVASKKFEQLDRFSSFHQCAFLSSARAGNKAATEYFFQQLTSEERDSSLIRAVYDVVAKRRDFCFGIRRFDIQENVSDTLCYLLTVVAPEQQIQVLKEHPYQVLRCFLDWPKQDLFLDIADLIRTFLPESDYGILINDITRDIKNAGYYFPNLIQKFFLLSPTEFRKHFVCALCSFFPEFLYDEDTETLKVFFRNVDPECRARLVLNSQFCRFLGDLILKGDWNLVKVCVREASLSKENKEKLKEGLLNEFRPRSREGKIIRSKRKLTRFFECLEETEVSASDK
ncbi:hypothetical protein AVEN_136723-1 [Araneus ventricosus]|uniref:Uncharacterized protein n=1 Tax=Araneus ventricosus TaxID=182803 RepID=A0A4Y2ESE1_ARAVE|nr:hypothetical protein AVEN_136723-1 [Araneus ventricosus]